MSDSEPLDVQRVMTLVTDAMEVAVLGVPASQGAAEILAKRRPSLREVAAAARENHQMHGGAEDPLVKYGFEPQGVPENVDRLRIAIDGVLEQVASLLAEQ